MISDLRLVELAAEAYSPPWTWISDGHVRARRFDEGGYVIVAFPGTVKNGLDILRDIRFAPWWHHRVGVCPAGALKGVQNIIDALLLDLAEPIKAGRLILIGHSLGGQEALIAAGWLVSLGYPPAAVVAFDPPRAGMWKLRRLVAKISEARYYWNGDDPVPRDPPVYLHPARGLHVGDQRGLKQAIADHRIAAIAAAMKAAAA